MFAIDLNDRALALARAGRVLTCEPSAVFDGSGREAAGTAAWEQLRRRPTAISTRHLRELSRPGAPGRRALALLAAELGRRLRECGPQPGEPVWIAVPAGLEPHSLALLLGLTRSLALPVDGFADAAVVSAAALGLDRPALVLDLGLHHCAATAVEGSGRAGRRRVIVSERGGLTELYQAWMALVGTTLVKRTRFDPLNDAVTEQQLFAAMPVLAREAALHGSAAAALEVGARRIETVLSRDQLAEVAQPIYRELLAALHALRTAGAPVALIVPQLVPALPGLREALEQFAGCELVTLADGFAAAALSVLDLPPRAPDAPVRLLRRLAARAAAECAPLAERTLIAGPATRAARPTHLLHEGKAIELGPEALVIGRAPLAGPALRLPEGLAAVSRRHCTLLPQGAERILVDHSSYGTFVNGERVAERVSVRAGDRVRIGEPGVELALIALDAATEQDDATPQN